MVRIVTKRNDELFFDRRKELGDKSSLTVRHSFWFSKHPTLLHTSHTKNAFLMMHRRSPRQQQHLHLVVAVALSTILAFASVPSVHAQSLDVQVDCDTKQVIISFDGISNPSENWIGIYRETILTNTLPSLPDNSLELWENWFNTCQSKNDCSDWPSSGDVVFNGLITTVQLRAILATGESIDTDAVSEIFRIDGDCATSGGDDDDDDDDDDNNTDDSGNNNNNDDATNSNDDILAAVQECHDDLQALIEDNLALIGLVRTLAISSTLRSTTFLPLWLCVFCCERVQFCCGIGSSLPRVSYFVDQHPIIATVSSTRLSRFRRRI